MNSTQAFFLWFFAGLNGLGGWFLFMLLAVAALVWLLFDTSRRRLPALGWKTAVLLVSALLIPAIIYRFSGLDTQLSLNPFIEPIFYLGLLGGILPVVLSIGYYVTYQGQVGCPNGHVYEAALGKCPECAREQLQNMPPPMRVEPAAPRQPAPQFDMPPAPPPPAPKPKAQAWLVAADGHSYQLNCLETTIGRGSENDIQLSLDTTVSRQHAKIQELNGHFKILDLGSKSGTRVNNQLVRQPLLLEPDDEVRFGDNTIVRFVTARR